MGASGAVLIVAAAVAVLALLEDGCSFGICTRKFGGFFSVGGIGEDDTWDEGAANSGLAMAGCGDRLGGV